MVLDPKSRPNFSQQLHFQYKNSLYTPAISSSALKMKNKRLQSSAPSQEKGDRGPVNMIDFISKTPDDVLVMILSRLIVKDAVITGSLSTRWKHLWRNLSKLNFDGTETLDKMPDDEMLCDLEQRKFIKQVNNVISSHNNPMIKEFLIRFDLDASYSEDIDKWIQFALEKKVEKLELHLTGTERDLAENYDLRLPSSNAMIVKTLSLKEVILDGVNLNEPNLNIMLNMSPHLVKLCVYDSKFSDIHIGGQNINLKHLKLVDCYGFESISLYGFGLVTFTYCGPEIEFHLTDLPKLREVDMGEVSLGLENNVFSVLSSCSAYLEVLILDMWTPKKGLDVNAIIKFPNVKKLMLVMAAEEDDSLLEFTSVARACPRLETFSISLHWYSPMKKRTEVRRVVAPEGHKHLQLLEIIGYYGRISDLELAVYVIESTVALKKIVIDTCCHALGPDFPRKKISKRERAARSSAKRQITPILPPGVNLAIL